MAIASSVQVNVRTPTTLAPASPVFSSQSSEPVASPIVFQSIEPSIAISP